MAFDPDQFLEQTKPAQQAPQASDPNFAGQFLGATAPPTPTPWYSPIPSLSTMQGVQNEAGLWGPVDRFNFGFLQGFGVDPAQAILNPGNRPASPGVQARLDALRQASESGPAGEAGRVVGSIADPLNRLIPELRVTGEFAPTVVRAGEKLVDAALRGGLGSLTTPIEGRAKNLGEWAKKKLGQAETGAGVGAVLGVPGAIASKLSFPNVQGLGARMLKAVPEAWRERFLQAVSHPGFDRVWHEFSLEPLGGSTPTVAGHAANAAVGKQIGDAIDKATAGMSYNASGTAAAPSPGLWALGLARARGMAQLGTNQPARDQFNSIIHQYVEQPFANYGWRLNSARFQEVQSNLAARIRRIPEDSDADRALKRELSQYRMTMLDNATMTPDQRQAYGKARLAWARHATAIDSLPQGSPDGIFTPSDVAREMDRRESSRYGRGHARDQAVANQAQQAMFRSGKAARQALRGQPLTQPEDYAQRAGAVVNQPPVRQMVPFHPMTQYGYTP